MLEVDWAAIAGGVGVFITSVVLTWRGWTDRRKELEEPQSAQLVAGVIQDNRSIHDNTEATRELTAAVIRLTDVLMMASMVNHLTKHD